MAGGVDDDFGRPGNNKGDHCGCPGGNYDDAEELHKACADNTQPGQHDDNAGDVEPAVRGGPMAAGHGVRRRSGGRVRRPPLGGEVVELQLGPGRERGRRLGAGAELLMLRMPRDARPGNL